LQARHSVIVSVGKFGGSDSLLIRLSESWAAL